MLKTKLLAFYKKNPEILEEMVRISINREVGYMFENGGFGKRPYTLENEGDILELVKKGAISFHMSVERWINPLQLSTKLKKRELNDLRIGWDFVIDLDSKNFDISKYTAYLILKFLKNNEIKNVYIKYSGGKGFHIFIPWETLPKKVKIFKKEEIAEEETKNLFPELARIVASYIASQIEKDLRRYIEINFGIEELIRENNLDILPEKFSPFHIIEIDTILISSRHLIRMPYSINEKTERLSVPIRKESVLSFNPEVADLGYYTYEGIEFLPDNLEEDKNVAKLFRKAIIWSVRNSLEQERIKTTQIKASLEQEIEKDIKRSRAKFKGKVPKEYFPPCIKNILEGVEDGRKRAVFILINFLYNLGWGWDEIERELNNWNENNPDPLRERYIEYQISWHKDKYNKGLKYLPPNCSNEGYYKDMGVCQPDEICKLVKNPISYPIKKLKLYKSKEDSKA